jgi:glycosyltransferase involved in cell wall biosynthesis
MALLRLKRDLGRACWLSFTTWANILNVLTPSGDRVVVSSHNRESENIKGKLAPLMRRLVSLTYPRADLVVAVSDSVKADLVENFGVPASKITTIYNTVDLAEVTALKGERVDERLEQVLAGPSIVTVGRFIEQKGQWHLIRAFALMKKRLPEAKLVIVGKGPLRDYLTRTTRELGLRVWAAWESAPAEAMPESDVVFTGFLENPFAVLARARVFAFPSLWEGFGNVILEALACGVPAVVADCVAGPREILAPEGTPDRRAVSPEYAAAGILMPVFDAERRPASEPPTATEQIWADTLARMLTDGELRKSYEARGSERARAFSVDAIAEQWRRVLLVESRQGRAASTVSMTKPL